MVTNETFSSLFSGNNAAFIEAIYLNYLENPESVDSEWQQFFSDLGSERLEELEKTILPQKGQPASAKTQESVIPLRPVQPVSQAASPLPGQVSQETKDSISALMLIRAYRAIGHMKAQLDPLRLENPKTIPELDPHHYGFTDTDLDRSIYIGGVLGRDRTTLREILSILEERYCSTFGTEFMHILNPAEKSWIQERLENRSIQFSPAEKIRILEELVRAAAFERFLQVKYPSAKRFGLEGGEAMVASLENLVATSAQHGIREVVIGMAHRGRLNVLVNVMGKPARALFKEFHGKSPYAEEVQGSGDVKYHLGSSSDRDFNGTVVHLSLTANPSHLEAVNPVVVGKVRAKQTRRGDKDRSEVTGLLIHGDAAFAGQGIVAEILLLSDLEGYTTGGTIHFIINNQIGFTTFPVHSRSSAYCSDIAKSIGAPVFHVNGDDPEAVVFVSQMAAEFRALFKQDVVIDMVCYRRHGHNEMDEPGFTQPLMYEAIRNRKPIHELYAGKLIEEGILKQEDFQKMVQEYQETLQREYEQAESYTEVKADWLEGSWSGMEGGKTLASPEPETGVQTEVLKEIGKSLASVPETFNLHPRLNRLLTEKGAMFETDQGFDWATAEALAVGSLLLEGFPVRLSGQDSGRGTFSHRHARFTDQKTGEHYMPLNNIRVVQEQFEVVDSPLSEAAVLGFDHGYSLSDPRTLVMWEAQFGDFANGAQVITDQFISSGEAKWYRLSGLVMLLPHGLEGQGPEHSSARLERYLQLCAEDNIQVANCTTPANYFHVLRRQLHRKTRKPLILMTPKSLLRHKLATSQLQDMGPGTTFMPVIPEMNSHLVQGDQIRRVILCSGKVYYDILQEREKSGISDVAIVRLEQFYPFPADALAKTLSLYPKAMVIWCQEEPRNMGAWTFLDRRLEEVLRGLDILADRPQYIGRRDSASPATGYFEKHMEQQQDLIQRALGYES